MEEKNNAIVGIYVMGIPKRAELANKPCALTYSSANRQLVLTVTYDNNVENISFDINRIVSARNVVRTIMSQSEFKDNTPSQYNMQLLATAIAGTAGPLIGALLSSSGLLNSSNSGKVNYTSLNEVHITYINDNNEQRDLLIQTDLDPAGFIDLINNQISSVNR